MNKITPTKYQIRELDGMVAMAGLNLEDAIRWLKNLRSDFPETGYRLERMPKGA